MTAIDSRATRPILWKVVPAIWTAPFVEDAMQWKKPRVVEIAVGLEINSYACAAVK
jgi:coenzyme PQQ precursor peptide PqqA